MEMSIAHVTYDHSNETKTFDGDADLKSARKTEFLLCIRYIWMQSLFSRKEIEKSLSNSM